MNYFKNLTRPRKLAMWLTLFLAGTIIAVANLPFHAVLNTQTAHIALPATPVMNLPCSAAVIMPGEQTVIEAQIRGEGISHVSYLLDGDELKLRHVGILREIDCELNITLAPEGAVKLPVSMPFAARDGVRPVPLNGATLRTLRR